MLGKVKLIQVTSGYVSLIQLSSFCQVSSG